MSQEASQSIESAAILDAVIRTAIDGIVIIDHEGVIRRVNPAACELFGYEAGDLIGNRVNMIMPEPHRTDHQSYIDRYLATYEAHIIGIGREVDGLHSDGTTFPLRLAVSEIRVHDVVLFAGFLHDLTPVKQAQDEIERLNKDLEEKVSLRTEELQSAVNKLLKFNKQLEHEIGERQRVEHALKKSREELQVALKNEKELGELKSRFVSMASHEFRTPLSTILSSAALIGRYTESDQQEKRARHLERIRTSVDMLNGILNDFLSISKIEEGKVVLNPQPVRVNDLCHQVVEDAEGLLKPGQQIVVSDDTSNIQLAIDKIVLTNILFNLISNAIKYSGENTEIRCHTSRDNDKLRIDIIDQGMGIPVDDQKYLFTRFFRASNATNIQGTGLGLNIVAGYVQMLHGSIDYTSIPDEGSTFTVHIPIENEGQNSGN